MLVPVDAVACLSGLGSLLGPVLKASGCRLIVFAPCSNARCVLAMYSCRDGATMSVLMRTRPCSSEMPRCPRVCLVVLVEELMERRIMMATSAGSALWHWHIRVADWGGRGDHGLAGPGFGLTDDTKEEDKGEGSGDDVPSGPVQMSMVATEKSEAYAAIAAVCRVLRGCGCQSVNKGDEADKAGLTRCWVPP